MAQHAAWHLPLGYKDGVVRAERVPSGAYLGDRDMFLFLVDGNRNLDDPTDDSQAGLFRGFMLRNSDVGAAALSLDVFLFRAVCGNHIIWGFHHVAGFRRRHIGASIHDAWTHSLREDRAVLDADVATDRTILLRATSQEIGATRDEVIDGDVQRLELSRKQAGDAYTLAEQHERNPRSVWGYVQGLTRLSQQTPWQDTRLALDRAASRLLTTINGSSRRCQRTRASIELGGIETSSMAERVLSFWSACEWGSVSAAAASQRGSWPSSGRRSLPDA
jgi:hypothetical protein